MNTQPNQDDYEEEFEEDDIEEIKEHFRQQNLRSPVGTRRHKRNDWLGPVMAVVIVVVIAFVGYFVWSLFATKIPSGVVTTNPTADAMNTEASVILTQVSGGSSAVLSADGLSTQAPDQQNQVQSYLATPTAYVVNGQVCRDSHLVDKGCDAGGCWVITSTFPQKVYFDKTAVDSYTIGQLITTTCYSQ